MDLVALINEQIISLELSAESKEAAIKIMADKLLESGFLSDRDKYVEAVLVREQKGSTGVGFEIAIPHGKSAGVKRSALAIAKLNEPIDWQSLDDRPVKMFFLIAVPQEQAGDEHLKILSSLSRKLIHEEFRNQLLAAKTPTEIIDIIKTI